jgi:hypothetical protein
MCRPHPALSSQLPGAEPETLSGIVSVLSRLNPAFELRRPRLRSAAVPNPGAVAVPHTGQLTETISPLCPVALTSGLL